MRTKTFLAGTIFFQILCIPQPVRCQNATSEPVYPLILLKMPMEAIPPIQYCQAPLPPPFDSKIVVAVREKCCGRSQHVQIQLANDTLWKGEVAKLNDADSFDFRRRGSRRVERIHYQDVVSVTTIGPGFEDVARKAGEYAGLVAFAVLMFPFIFAMGLGCNFQCS
jgi:hypothetical protein